ncbi:MAG TPA: PCRF domain-containing protein, partial [Smithella sp.]|nr:PCRF domain-containing protein [Smithella sp.]
MKIKDLEELSLKKDFWNDQDYARSVLQKKTNLSEKVERWDRFSKDISDIENLAEMAVREKDEHVLQDIDEELEQLNAAVAQEELKMMLNGEQDAMNAIVSIHA